MSVAVRPPAFVNDLETCVGCHACAVACANENQLAPGTSWRHIVTFNEARRPGLPTFHLSLACNHCRDAPCLTACPARAIARDARTGAVLIDAGRCVGCRYCSWVCPYDAPRFDDDAGVMRKCTLCHGRLVDGLAPACVSGCPVGALTLGDPVAGEPVRLPGFPAMGIGPGIRFLPVRTRVSSHGASTAVSAPPLVPHASVALPTAAPKISARSEWTLVAFTFVAQILVGLVLAATVAGVAVRPWPFLAAGLCAISVSTMHLGRPLRAWRAVLNVRTSWLSREVLSWSVFLALGTLALGWAGSGPGMRWTAALAGLLCLACVDRVYAVMARPARTRLDDVSALTGALYFGAVFAGSVLLGVALALWRITALRHRVTLGVRVSPRAGGAALARSVLTAAGLGLLAQETALARALALTCILGAELIDRIVFYDTLDIVTPRTQMARDTAATV